MYSNNMTTSTPPAKRKRSDQCFACTKRACRFRIYTKDGQFDELACPDHQKALCKYADETLNGAMRNHLTSSANLRRYVDRDKQYDEFLKFLGCLDDGKNVSNERIDNM